MPHLSLSSVMKTITRPELTWAAVPLLLVLCCGSVWPQGVGPAPTGIRRPPRSPLASPAQIRGSVQDAQGHPLTQVVVTLTLKETGRQQG